MKIKWIEFENLETGLKIERVNFFDDITLLVGLSGAGKTQIIEAIQYSLNLALNRVKKMQSYKTTICIEISDHIYEWEYSIGKAPKEDIISLKINEEYYFNYEKLIKDGELLFKRDSTITEVKGYENLPKPKKGESLISQYSEDKIFQEFKAGIEKLYDVDIDVDIKAGIDNNSFNAFKPIAKILCQKKPEATFNIFSKLPSLVKLYIVKQHYKEIFDNILEVIQEIFPEIEDVDVAEDTDMEFYYVCITVYGKQIHQRDISSGMLKTIYYILEIFTNAKNALIIIDEFENGLGMNCIDAVIESMQSERPDVQFIITSHHPKIINSIDHSKWKIIEREKNIVKNYNSNHPLYDLGGNKHDAYYNLLNKWSYEGKL